MAQGKSATLPQDLATEIGVEDLYEFLGVDSASTEKEVCIYIYMYIVLLRGR